MSFKQKCQLFSTWGISRAILKQKSTRIFLKWGRVLHPQACLLAYSFIHSFWRQGLSGRIRRVPGNSTIHSDARGTDKNPGGCQGPRHRGWHHLYWAYLPYRVTHLPSLPSIQGPQFVFPPSLPTSQNLVKNTINWGQLPDKLERGGPQRILTWSIHFAFPSNLMGRKYQCPDPIWAN